MDNCELTISTKLRVAFPAINWRTDSLIAAPVLFLPVDTRSFCLDATGANSKICLQWFPVTLATHYLVQWCLDEQFSGPSLQEALVVAFPVQNTSYCMQLFDDVRQGDSVFWRVQAADLISGGVSVKSAIRKFVYSCGDPDTQNQTIATPCEEFDVQAIIKGKNFLSCCDYGTYWIELSYGCTDVYGNSLVELIGVDWSIGSDAAVIVPNGDGIYLKTGVKTCATESQVFEVSATLRFQDKFFNTFECDATPFAVLADCGDPTSSNFQVTLDGKFRESRKGILSNCGQEVFLQDDCLACSPCCKQFLYQNINTASFASSIVLSNLKYDPQKCTLEYELAINIPSNPLLQFFEVMKGSGKKVITTPTEELEDRWIFELPVSTVGLIRVAYKGCWRYEDDPYFTIVHTIRDPNQDPQDTTVTTYLGEYVRCVGSDDCNTEYKRSTEFAVIGGPVYSVDEVQCTGDSWPSCIDDCSCDYGRLQVAYNGKTQFLETNKSIKFNVDCECGIRCSNGYITLEIVDTEIWEDCSRTETEISFRLFCDDIELYSQNATLEAFCDSSYTQDILIQYCECEFDFEFKNISGVYGTATTECECIQDKISLCLKIGETAKCIENITWQYGKWNLPNDTRLTIADVNYSLSKLEFIGCDLWATICRLQDHCSPCAPITCICGVQCNSAPKTFQATVDFVESGSPSGSTSIVFNIDCERKAYISDIFAVESGVNSSCDSTGVLIYDEDGLRFEGRDSRGTLMSSTNYGAVTFDCESGLYGDINVINQCYTNGVASGTIPIDLIISSFDWQECDVCDYAQVKLDVSQCLPLIASGTETLDETEIEVSIGNAEILDSCGCKIPGALEARVNIPLGCGLTVGTDDINPNQKTITIDYDSLVGEGKDSQSLDVSDKGGCPHITLPVCRCTEYEVLGILPSDPTRVVIPFKDAYLFKGATYIARAMENIPRGKEGKVNILDYESLNPGFIVTTIAQNSISSNIIIGQKMVLTVTSECEILLTSKYEDLIVPTGDPNSFFPQCEGTCKWNWNFFSKIWEQDPSNTCDVLAPPTTSSPPSTLPPYCDQDAPGYCILTCVDLNFDGVGEWLYEGRYDASADNHICDPFEQFIACSELGQRKCVASIPVTGAPPIEGCVYQCIKGSYEFVSENCPDNWVCDDTIESQPCGRANVTTIAPCIEATCGCVPPTGCGLVMGDCTYTDCSTNHLNVPPPNCTGTTPTPPTTSYPGGYKCCVGGLVAEVPREDCCELGGILIAEGDDCPTCDGGCVWRRALGTNSLGQHFGTWALVSNDCPRSSSTCREYCYCEAPLNYYEDPCQINCDIRVTTPCIYVCRESNPQCSGACLWIWDCLYAGWQWIDISEWPPLSGQIFESYCFPTDGGPLYDSCGNLLNYCGCPYPPERPADSSIAACTFTTCRRYNYTDPFFCGGDPCGPTPAPRCEGVCTYRSVPWGFDFIWEFVSSECEGPNNCGCVEPPDLPTEDCQVTFTVCQSGVPTTSTPPTTGTPPTTSAPTTPGPTTPGPTTVPPELGSCCEYTADPCFICTDTLFDDCAGFWLPGTCDSGSVECDMSPGACCIDGECMMTSTCFNCNNLGGIFYPGQECEFGNPPVFFLCPPDPVTVAP